MIQLKDLSRAAPFFTGRHDTLIRACLEGYHGSVWADNAENPHTLAMISCDFTFFGGTPNRRIFQDFPWECTNHYTVFAPHDEAWERIVRAAFPEVKCWERYSILHEPDVFDEKLLQSYIAALPEPYKLEKIDENLYQKSFEQEWSSDFCSHFADYEAFSRLGGGYMVTLDGVPVAGASSYARYADGIELEVDTAEAHRRKGLARAASAAMILDCRRRGLYASWDASGRISVALAESLGYHEKGMYHAYFVKAPATTEERSRGEV